MMLPARGYESEHTKFMRELMQKKPEIVQQQRESRAIWWDKSPLSIAEERVLDQGRVAQSPYVYATVE